MQLSLSLKLSGQDLRVPLSGMQASGPGFVVVRLNGKNSETEDGSLQRNFCCVLRELHFSNSVRTHNLAPLCIFLEVP